METVYGKKVIEHFSNPKGCRKMKNPHGIGKYISPGCGDTVWIYIKVNNECISDISFQARGCPSAIACASILTEMVLGKHVDDAALIIDEHIVSALGGLPRGKEECSAIAARALHEAIYDYVFRIEGNTGERKAEIDAAK